MNNSNKKHNYLSANDLAKCISNLIAQNVLWIDKTVKIYFIVNTKAGCFTNKRISAQYYKLFTKKSEIIKNNIVYAKNVQYSIFSTEKTNHAHEITTNILKKIENEFIKDEHYIIISCGGDGTSLDVQTALYKYHLSSNEKNLSLMDNLTILRLPLGTGNDGTDGSFITECFSLLQDSIEYKNSDVLVAYTNNKPSLNTIKESNSFISKYCTFQPNSPWYSFNISSIGLDAFVTFITNLVKTRFPGNLYHLCIPISGLFYSRVFEYGDIKIELYKDIDDGSPYKVYDKQITLAVMGVSGYRTYGGGHKVLPDDNNICISERISVPRLIRDSKKYIYGTHVGTAIGNMFKASKIVIHYNKPLMLQCDGECYLLCKEHFPLTIEKRSAGFKIIKRCKANN